MLILGIDTATSVCSLALYDGRRVLAEWNADSGLTHSEKMMPQLEALLQSCALDKTALRGIAVSIGPGSFTGLRIGVTSAKTLAYALDIPVTGVTTPLVLAYNLPAPGIWLSPLIDGQKGQVYQTVYEWRDGRMLETEKIALKPLTEALALLARSGRECRLLGECLAEPADGWPENVRPVPPYLAKPRASVVAMLGYDSISAGKWANPVDLEPWYMKKSEAELLWEQRRTAK